MDTERRNKFRRILDAAGFKDEDYVNYDWWLAEEQQYETPILSKAVFLRETWQAILPENDPASLRTLIGELKSRSNDGDDYYQSRIARLNPRLLERLTELAASADAEALLYLVRSAQIDAVSAMVRLIDGGQVFADETSATWKLVATDNAETPSRDVGQLGDLFWKFDPAGGESSSKKVK